MNRLENLAEITERRLGGLSADTQLLARIRTAAAEQSKKRRVRWKPVLISCVAAGLCLCIGLWALPDRLSKPAVNTATTADLLGTRAAGDEIMPMTGERIRALDVPAGNISVGAASVAGSYRNLFAPEHNGNFPLLMVDNAAYRMLISPTNMNERLLGDSLGEVTEYTLEPALSTGGIVSNIVSAGDTVYAVQGMRGAMAAAYVKGSLRMFQRVSFAGTAILGDETLGDTLAAAEHITAMELTGAGVIDDPATAQTLMQTLLDNAEYESASVGTGDTRSLLIGLDNGLLMQLMVGDDDVSGCGTWSCPEFFEAYATAVQAE